MVGYDDCSDCHGNGMFTLNGKLVVCGIQPPPETFVPALPYPGMRPSGLAFQVQKIARTQRPPGLYGKKGQARLKRRKARDEASRKYWNEYLAAFRRDVPYTQRELYEIRRQRQKDDLAAISKRRLAEDG